MNQRAKTPRVITSTILLFGLLFFIVRGIQFVFIESYAPLILSGVLLILAAVYFSFNGKVSRIAIKAFGLILILYSVIKILLGLLLKIAPVDSMHASESTSIFYFLVSILVLFVGYYLFRAPIVVSEKSFQ